jgi:hypothetical protein
MMKLSNTALALLSVLGVTLAAVPKPQVVVSASKLTYRLVFDKRRDANQINF